MTMWGESKWGDEAKHENDVRYVKVMETYML